MRIWWSCPKVNLLWLQSKKCIQFLTHKIKSVAKKKLNEGNCASSTSAGCIWLARYESSDKQGTIPPTPPTEYMKIIAIFYYPILYYPLLACATLQRKVGYVFGALLSFGHFGVLLWQKFDCPKTPEVRQHVFFFPRTSRQKSSRVAEKVQRFVAKKGG